MKKPQMELAEIAWKIQEREPWKNEGVYKHEYLEKLELGLQRSTPSFHSLCTVWGMILFLGADDQERLRDVQVSKVLLLRPGIVAGVINEGNIWDWLDRCREDGPKWLRANDLRDEVQAAVRRKR